VGALKRIGRTITKIHDRILRKKKTKGAKMETFTNCQNCDIDLNEEEAYPNGEDYICEICLDENQRDDAQRTRYYAEMFTRIS
jgi:hypothetical protein